VVIGLTTALYSGRLIRPGWQTRWSSNGTPDRFAYGTLAALRVAPFMAGDWGTIAAARRLRGISPGGVTGRAASSETG